MLYPIAIEPGDDSRAFGVVVPDIPGCFSAGDTLDEAIANAREAIDFHLDGLAEDNAEIPVASSFAKHQANPEYAGWIWAVVEVDVTRYLGKAEKINITLPADDLARMLLGLLMGLRVLARSRPEPELLRGLVRPALALLDGAGTSQRRSRK